MERVSDHLSLHTVEVPGNVDPYGRPDNSFDAEVVLTSWTGPPSFDVVAISENVLWICAFPFAVSHHAFAFTVSPLGCNVAQVGVGTMVVEVGLVDFQLLSALVPVSVCFFCLMLWDCLHKFFILATRLRGMHILDAKFAPCVDLAVTSPVSHYTTSGTETVFFFLLYWQL